MVTKAALPDQNSLAGFKKLKELLLAYEAELRRKKSLLPDQELYTKGRRGNQRRQESTGPATHSVSGVIGKSQRPNSFGGTCHGCGKKGHKKADCWQERNITAPGGGGRKKEKIRQSLSQRGQDFGANNNHILHSDEEAAIATKRKADTLRERGRETYSGEEVDHGYTVECVLGGVGMTNKIGSVVDSGCTNHMTGNHNAFVKETYVSLSANQRQMKTATGSLSLRLVLAQFKLIHGSQEEVVSGCF